MKTNKELLILIIYFILSGIIYFMIFGCNIPTLMCSVLGIPIVAYILGIILLAVNKIILLISHFKNK